MNLTNCRQCGKLYQRGVGYLCPDCQKNTSDTFQNLVTYIKENPNLHLREIAAACHVSERELESLVFDGKLGATSTLVVTDCNSCKATVTHTQRKGRLCHKCSGKLDLPTSKPEDEKGKKTNKWMRGKEPEPASPPTGTETEVAGQKGVTVDGDKLSRTALDHHEFKQVWSDDI
ncbi:MAG: hypothetical protein K2X01_06435 [Cyanobacteria bacterium]|nr:hypothetical protein [Cyanobacteriota bacterium]